MEAPPVEGCRRPITRTAGYWVGENTGLAHFAGDTHGDALVAAVRRRICAILGIAFFFMRAQRTNTVSIIASVACDVVLADMVFTATAVIIQPFSGMALALMAGYPVFSAWLLLSAAIYFVVGACWLRVEWLQIWMRDMAIAAAATSRPAAP